MQGKQFAAKSNKIKTDLNRTITIQTVGTRHAKLMPSERKDASTATN